MRECRGAAKVSARGSCYRELGGEKEDTETGGEAHEMSIVEKLRRKGKSTGICWSLAAQAGFLGILIRNSYSYLREDPGCLMDFRR